MFITAQNEIIELLGNADFPRLESASLRLNKYLQIDNKDKELKRKQLEAVIKLHNNTVKIPPELPVADGSKAFYFTTAAPMVINQAGGVIENANMALHRHFNSPYLPGSAVKGAARHAAWEEWSNAEGKDKLNLAVKIALAFGFPANDDRQEQSLNTFLKNQKPDMFGENGTFSSFAGTASFLDAFPVTRPVLELDIVNCHHAEYYSGRQEKAADSENPIPNYFLRVGAGVKFKFIISPVKRWNSAQLMFPADQLLDFAERSLKKALTQNGMGAKTAAGYGWFKEV